MKKITITFALLFLGAASLSAQIQVPKKAVKKQTVSVKPTKTSTIKVTPKKTNEKPKDLSNVIAVNRQMQLKKNKEKLERESFKSGSNNKSATSNTGSMKLEIVSNNFDNGYNPKKGKASKNITKDALSCTTRTIDINANTLTFGNIGAKSGAPDWMKPGVVLKASDFLRGSHKMEIMKRHPIVYSTSLAGFGDVTRTIQKPENSSNLVSAINHLKAKSGNTAPANITHTFKEIHSLDELGFKLTGKYSNSMAGVSVSLGVDYGTKKERHYYMVDFIQNMFDIDVSPKLPEEVFINPNQPVNDLIYISRVTYGRRGIVVVESKLDVEEFGLQLDGSMETLFESGELKVGVNTLKRDEDFSIHALIYGGNAKAATSSLLKMAKEKSLNLDKWMNANPSNPKLALPIAYELKNMNNQSLGMRSNFNRPVETCLPAITETVKLKVTLTDLICAESKDDGGNGDDYGLSQFIVYKVNGKEQGFIEDTRDITKFSNRIDKKGQNQKENDNQLINGNKDNQLHVRQSRVRNTNINNSMVFEITPEALNSSSTKFEIHTWLKEYTSGSDELLTANSGPHGYKKINVKLKEVVEYLLRPSDFSEDFSNECFNWGSITDKQCKPLGTRNADLWLTEGSNNTYVDAPISLGRKDARGAVWMRFELVD
jgi:hypothetical protein